MKFQNPSLNFFLNGRTDGRAHTHGRTIRNQYASHFIARLSQRLIGELIGYPWSGVRPSSTMLKDLLL